MGERFLSEAAGLIQSEVKKTLTQTENHVRRNTYKSKVRDLRRQRSR